MVQGQAVIEILTEQLNAIKLDNYYTLGLKDGLKQAIEVIELAETVQPFKQEVSHA